MIRQSTTNVMEVKRTFLSNLTILCTNNKENMRTVLQMSVWQDLLYSMVYLYPQTQHHHKVTEMVMTLFRMLLHHAIKFELLMRISSFAWRRCTSSMTDRGWTTCRHG
ncbi:hypothetical protein DPMN_004652 [Dreissena polymorpha]|uniref:DUF4704 domain-containing protein n=1 Tax=Dreissena polymorpha TaxID=45954 RepID=A0A9D4MNV6_DREPO|nr:hypothetical protein DPMN_004652 [Dreissena polymorpha]